MTAITVHTQAELDAALNDPAHTYSTHEIVIDSPAGVWLEVSDDHGQDVRAFNSSKVIAFGSSSVTAHDSATVRAHDSSSVTAFGSATITASGSSAVIACDSSAVTAFNSSAVTAFNSSTVTARDSSTVTARDSSTVWAFNSAMVAACGSSTVTARDSAMVAARDSSTVNASDSSTVTAASTVSIHKTNDLTNITGGVVIDHTTTDATTPTRWATENGASVSGGEVKLYKALPDNLASGLLYGRPTVWAVGEEVTCDDWRADDKCGGGLHLSPTPGHARHYLDYETRPRFLECVAPIDTIIPLHGDVAKCKAPRVRVVREVDMMGRPVTSEAAKS